MKLIPKEQEGLLIHQAGYLAQKRLARGLKLNYPEAVALIACQILELARDGHSTVFNLMDKGQQMLELNLLKTNSSYGKYESEKKKDFTHAPKLSKSECSDVDRHVSELAALEEEFVKIYRLQRRKQVMEGVGEIIHEVQVEATFPDGTKMVTVHYPICRENGDLNLALYGSFLPVPSLDRFETRTPNLPENDEEVAMTPPGCIYPAKEKDIEINAGRDKVAITIKSLCDRPIQIGSHFNFIEANKDLVFDRALAYGKRLNIPAGNAVRFEPGITETVTLVDIAGKRIVRGGNSLCDGPVVPENLKNVMEKIRARGFGYKMQLPVLEPDSCFMSRFLYARTFGPTTGDKVRLGDTSLVLEVEKDFVTYGDECKFGGGKVIREGMGQASQVSVHDALDTVMTNCLIVDPIQRIVKADIGIKNGRIFGIGKAGNDDIMGNVTTGMIIGTGTDVIAGEGFIVTAGGIDCHVHFICPQLIKHAISSGITTLVGGGTGPSTGTFATTCCPGYFHIKSMIQSTDAFPMNFGFTGKGNTSRSDDLSTELVEQIEAGAIGLKIHEDWGATPSAVDTALSVAEAYDIQINIHTDTLNESCSLEDTVNAFKGRTIHAYHIEGAGGGHSPDILAICNEPNVIPSSTDPTRPYTLNTFDEHFDMLMVCHHLDRNLKADVAFAESRIRTETIAAEDILHDMGAISIISSDSQAMGRIGEVITRTWQTADKMKKQRGRLPEENGSNDNFRILRYIAKYTINPAIAQGLSHMVGSIEVGKLADLVLWRPAFFGVKPYMIIKGGQIVWAEMGNPNASIPTPQPVIHRKMFGAYGKSVGQNSCIFASKISIERGNVQNYGIHKTVVPVFGVRKIGKQDMLHNNLLPGIKVDPETFRVSMRSKAQEDEENTWTGITCAPAPSLPLSRRYFLF